MKRIVFTVFLLVLATISCRTGSSERSVNLFPSATVTFANTITPIVPTQTAVIVVVSATPKPSVGKCVNAIVAVYLRPSPSNENYPIMVLPNSVEVIDLGGRSGKWLFVQYNDKQGWVHSEYLQTCT